MEGQRKEEGEEEQAEEEQREEGRSFRIYFGKLIRYENRFKVPGKEKTVVLCN